MRPKVKIIKGMTLSSLEEQINEFLDTFIYENLIDIKMIQIQDKRYNDVIAMIMYEE